MSAGIAALLAQTAEMSGKAAFQTLAVVGDDTAISANQMIGGQPERKIPMVWRVVKGSLRNKAIIIPVALLFSYTMPGLILASLAVGGVLLSFDSVDKLVHKKLSAPKGPVSEAYANDHVAWENRHVKRALKTDLVLSAETTVVSLWAVAAAPFIVQAGAVVAAGLAMTAGVYTVVASIIKMDDMGKWLKEKQGNDIMSKAMRAVGKIAAPAAPKLIKVIGALGTAAMFVVGGTMIVHGIPGAEHLVSGALGFLGTNPLVHGAGMAVANAGLGIVAGFAALPVAKVIGPPLGKLYDKAVALWHKIRPPKPVKPEDRIDDEPLPEPSKDALKGAPDVKAALANAVAAKPANQNTPTPVPKPECKAPELR